MKIQEAKKYFLLFCLIIIAYLSYKIVLPYLTAIITSAILAYIFYPVFKKLKEKTKKPHLASILTCTLVVIIILLPILIISNILIQESVGIYNTNLIQQVEEFTTKYTSEEFPYSGVLSQVIYKAVKYIQASATNLFVALPAGIFSFLIAIYTLYFLFIKGEWLVKQIKNTIPLREKDKLINNIAKKTYSIVYGLFAIAVIEVIIAAIGFSLLGLSSPIMWSLIIGFLALIPFIGPAIVWVPFAIIELVKGDIYLGTGIIVLGVILSAVDTFVRPKIIGAKSNMSPAVVLIGLLGGLQVFGFIGLIIGPLILSTLLEILKLYHEDKFDIIK